MVRSARLIVAFALATVAAGARADTVTLVNGDTLTGTIGQVTAKQMVFKSPAFGEVKIDVSKIKNYAFDNAVRVQPKTGPSLTTPVTGDAKQVKAGDTTYAYDQLKSVNPPPEEWTGSLVANFSLARGNTNRYTLGGEAKAALRRDNDQHDDRFDLAAAYHYGETGTGDDQDVDTDNFLLGGKYDRFYGPQFYGYLTTKLEHDRIADLYYRVTPGVGVGYQWIETPKTKFNTEAGVTYIHEEFTDDDDGTSGGANDSVALRLAYHFEHKISDKVNVFHNLEYLPAFDDPADFILDTDIGLRAALTEKFFAQFKVLFKHDSTPAEDATENDLLYTVGVGWQF